MKQLILVLNCCLIIGFFNACDSSKNNSENIESNSKVLELYAQKRYKLIDFTLESPFKAKAEWKVNSSPNWLKHRYQPMIDALAFHCFDSTAIYQIQDKGIIKHDDEIGSVSNHLFELQMQKELANKAPKLIFSGKFRAMQKEDFKSTASNIYHFPLVKPDKSYLHFSGDTLQITFTRKFENLIETPIYHLTLKAI